MSDPQDVAEGLDEEITGTDPVTRDEVGDIDMPVDHPYAVDENLVSEPIVDSVASRDDRLMPEADALSAELLGEEADLSDRLIADEVHLVADGSSMSAEESALHLTPEPDDDIVGESSSG